MHSRGSKILSNSLYVTDLKNGYSPSVYIMIMDIKTSVALFTMFMFPVAFILSVLVTISNISLIRKEGRTWRNMLGTILGIFLSLSTAVMVVVSSILPYRVAFSALMLDYLLYFKCNGNQRC